MVLVILSDTNKFIDIGYKGPSESKKGKLSCVFGNGRRNKLNRISCILK